MYQHILMPTDGSELSGKAVEAGLQLAAAVGARVTVMTVAEPFHALSLAVNQLEYTLDGYNQHVEKVADRILGEVSAKAKAKGVPCETVRVQHSHPYQAIIDTAVAGNCDLIAMASHGRGGVAAVVLGSETLRVLTHSKLPVLVYR